MGCISTPTSSSEAGGCTWQDIGFPDPGFQFGYNTLEDPREGRIRSHQKYFAFENPFLGPARILVWLTHINYTSGPLSIHLSVIDESSTGFTLNVAVGNESRVDSVGIAWVGYPQSRTNSDRGSFNTATGKDWKSPQYNLSGSHSLNQPIIAPVRTFAAVNGLDIAASTELALGVSVALDAYTRPASTIYWEYTVTPKAARLYSMGISYLLIV